MPHAHHQLEPVGSPNTIPPNVWTAVGAAMEDLLDVDQHLIVYGSLGPGGPNHDQMDGLEGEWREGWVTGTLLDQGWGAHLGYPVLRWDPAGQRVPAYLFTSADLPAHWNRLDTFEGEAYERLLVPFQGDDGVRSVGYLYALAGDR